MKNCFLISFFFPTKESTLILDDILNRLNTTFSGLTVFIGINPSPFLEDGIKIIESHKEIEILYGITPKNLVCDSDASGYQTTLKLLKDSKKTFDLYWFMHSKAVTTNRHEEREYMLNDFIDNKEKIESLFIYNDFIGSYGDMLIQLATLKEGNKFTTPTESGNYLDKFYDFNIKTPFEYFYAKTFFVVRGEIINNFIENCKESFFNDYLNINNWDHTDRYFFERDFIRIVDKMGYVILGKIVSSGISDNRWGNMSVHDSNMRYLEEMDLWIDKNHLELNKESVINKLKEWQNLKRP